MRIYSLIIANIFAVGLLLFSSFGTNTHAQINPVTNDTAVTATVIDRLAPSTPILISPEDGEKLNTGIVEFVWQESTDNWLMDHYTLLLNGAILFDNIPLTATSSAGYTLEYDALTGYYTLTIEDALSDGNYDWSITAWDYHGNSTSSVTWSFSIDTKAPDFTIIQIGEHEVEITTGNAESVPTEPLVLDANEPTLSGTGEKNSTVVLTITYPDGSTEKITFAIDGNGKWKITLGILPRDGIILLSFLITDPTGNISILEDIPIILYTPVVIIPIPEVPFFPQPEPPVVEVPVLPPKEYIPPVIRDAPEKVGYFIRNLAVKVTEEYRNWLDSLLSGILLFLLIALPLLKLLLLTQWYRHFLTPQLLKEFLWLIGWWSETNPNGIVTTRENQTAVQFSLVLFSGKNLRDEHISKTLISNDKGVFPTVDLPDGSYRISTHHPHYFFPTLEKMPPHLDEFSYYTGASLMVKNGVYPSLLVLVVEPLKKVQHTWSYQLRKAVLLAPSLSIPLAILSGCICLAYPSFINFSAAAVYAFLLLKKKLNKLRSKTEVSVLTANQAPVPNTIIGFQKDGESQLTALTQTNNKGFSKVPLPPDHYIVRCISFQHSLLEGDNKSTTRFKHDVSKNYLPLIVT